MAARAGMDAGNQVLGSESRAGADELRRRAAAELAARHSSALKHVARRYSLCAADAEDAYQRTLEILLTKAPVEEARDLLAWSKTVVKHEALAIRHNRERLLGTAAGAEEDRDPVALLPGAGPGPDERLERKEDLARSREALRTLKPAELRALTLLGQGYTYVEIGEITGFSRTKINRCLAEGRERFRRFLARSEEGHRCREMGLLLSRFCDGETSEGERAEVSEHLRACAACRATVRAYRTAPSRIAALAPALPLSRSIIERAQETLLGLQSRLPGFGGETSVAAMAGSRGAGTAALAKLLAVCGGTAACVATGVVPAPAGLAGEQVAAPRIERVAERVVEASAPAPAPAQSPAAKDELAPGPVATAPRADSAESAAAAPEAETVEYPQAPAPPPTPAPAPPPAAVPAAASAPPPSGSAAGEFGP